MSTHISQIILSKIEKENIKPKARWYFVIEHGVLWIPGVLVTILGAVAVAGTLYSVVHSGWEYSEFVYQSQVGFIIEAVPLLWIGSLFFFSLVIVKALRTTHSGYRLSTKGILFGSIAVSIILGVIIYTVDEIFEVKSLIRYQVQVREQHIVTSLEKGRLVGLVEKKYETSILVRDKNNILWDVDLSLLGSTTPTFVKEGKSINIIGTTTREADNNQETGGTTTENNGKEFIACAIFSRETEVFVHSSSTSNTKKYTPRMFNQNNNPDCKALLDEIKRNIRTTVPS